MTTEHTPDKDPLARDISAALDQSLVFDDASQTRLAEIRQQALAAYSPAGRHERRFWFAGAATAAACTLFATILLLPNTQPPTNPVTEMEWLLNNDDLNMLETELEFYAWADDEIANSG